MSSMSSASPRSGNDRGLFGPLSTQALASQIFGALFGLRLFHAGARRLARRPLIGQRNAVVLGALSMSGGHLAMAFDQSFLLALLLLIIGSGLLKGNISAQVGSRLSGGRRRAPARAASRSSAPPSISARSPGRCSAASSASATAGTSASAPPPCSCWAGLRPISAAIATLRRGSSGTRASRLPR